MTSEDKPKQDGGRDEDKSKQDKWPTNGMLHKDISRGGIYLNAEMKQFLNNNERGAIIIASKGMGKTLLMRVKKKILVSNEDGSLFIPSGSDEVDKPSIPKTIGQKGYNDILLWKGVWITSILLSILSHLQWEKDNFYSSSILNISIDSLGSNDGFKKQILSYLKNRVCLPPSYYLSIILDRSENEVRKIAASSNVLFNLCRRYIVSQVFVVIDEFDNALTESFPDNIEAWKYGQLGLAKAAYQLSNINSHIKVFATIRQEAWSGFVDRKTKLVDPDKEVIAGVSLEINYTSGELKTLFESAILRYEGKDCLSDFLGVNSIKNTYCDEDEDPFSYIYRHSVETPRSLMFLGGDLASARLLEIPEHEREKKIRNIVNERAEKTLDFINGQKAFFLKTLNTSYRINKIIELFPSNVLTVSTLKKINQEFSSSKGIEIDEKDSHPFCDLFNIGLLGRVQQDMASGGYIQSFKKPNKFNWDQVEILGNDMDSIFLLHPALASVAANNHASFHVNLTNVIGADRKWIGHDNGRDGIPQIFISHATNDKEKLTNEIFPTFFPELDLQFPSRIWIDQEGGIRSGQIIAKEIEEGVKNSDIVVLFISKNALSSGWVEREWTNKYHAEVKEGHILLVPAIIDETPFGKIPSLLTIKSIPRLDSPQAIKNLAQDVATHAANRLRALKNSKK